MNLLLDEKALPSFTQKHQARTQIVDVSEFRNLDQDEDNMMLECDPDHTAIPYGK